MTKLSVYYVVRQALDASSKWRTYSRHTSLASAQRAATRLADGTDAPKGLRCSSAGDPFRYQVVRIVRQTCEQVMIPVFEGGYRGA